MNPIPELLLIEDDPQIRRFLRVAIEPEFYRLREAVTAADGLAQAAARQPDLILLDLGLPDGDGLDLIAKVRQFSGAPILVISARGNERDRVAALDIGADDFIGKPFGTGELLARIRAALRRVARPAGLAGTIRFGLVEADLDARIVKVAGAEVHLTPIEFKLLQTLLRYSGRVVTQRQLLNEVWGPNQVEHAQYLRVYVAQLRRKLEENPARPRHLLTEPGVGYRMLIE
ncbi:MAG: response regulator [Bryobacterales bacterium]|nr:response regulator [Bryobacterales bacterium]